MRIVSKLVFVLWIFLFSGQIFAQKYSVRKGGNADTLKVKVDAAMILGDKYYKYHSNQVAFTLGSAVTAGLSAYLLNEGFGKDRNPAKIVGFFSAAASLACAAFSVDAYIKKGKIVRVGLNKIAVTF